MRFCLFTTGPGAGTGGRLGLVRARQVVDVHNACVASLSDRMSARRAVEIASAQCPSDLLGFLENGRFAWRALQDAIDQLGDKLADTALATPAGQPVVQPSAGLRLVPIAPWQLRWTPGSTGQWQGVPLPPDGPLPTTLHTDGRPYIHELLAVVGAAGRDIAEDDAWKHIALVAELHPTNRAHVGLLRTPEEIDPEDRHLRALIARAVHEASTAHPLLVGDVVRTGRSLLAPGATPRAEEDVQLDDAVTRGS
ncbi:MAG TPA: hypothetical protein VFO65_09040 [Acidimicrobiales bacterium]|nr:hypothetical protein [Acidimicrobiales bacterium]